MFIREISPAGQGRQLGSPAKEKRPAEHVMQPCTSGDFRNLSARQLVHWPSIGKFPGGQTTSAEPNSTPINCSGR